ELDGQPVHGVACGELRLAPDLPEGTYALTVSEANERFAEERRTLAVRRRPPARYLQDLTFDRSVYGPGEHVRATLTLHAVTGDPTGPGGATPAPMPAVPVPAGP